MTLGDGDRCIHVEATAPDRHHQVVPETSVAPDAPQPAIDFSLKPFNRNDPYLFKLYVVIPVGATEPKEIALGSATSVRFVEMPTATELLTRAAFDSFVKVGPFRLGLWR